MNDREMITVVLVRTMKEPEVVEIPDSLEAMQKLVGGNIEEYMPFEDDVAIICNEEGKIEGLDANRLIVDDSGEACDIICGDFFLVFAPVESERFLSMPPEKIEKYMKKFEYPEKICIFNGQLMVERVTSKGREMER